MEYILRTRICYKKPGNITGKIGEVKTTYKTQNSSG